jgi:hypothetical protein
MPGQEEDLYWLWGTRGGSILALGDKRRIYNGSGGQEDDLYWLWGTRGGSIMALGDKRKIDTGSGAHPKSS